MNDKLKSLVRRITRHFEQAEIFDPVNFPEDKWQSPMFPLCRRLKSEPEFQHKTPEEQLELFLECIEEAHEAWVDFEERMGDDDDWEMDFLRCMSEIRVPYGETPISYAVRLASLDRCRAEKLRKYCRFLRVLEAFSRIYGDHPVALPEEALGKALQVSARTISNYRFLASHEKLISEARRWSWADGVATTFRIYREPLLTRIEGLESCV